MGLFFPVHYPLHKDLSTIRRDVPLYYPPFLTNTSFSVCIDGNCALQFPQKLRHFVMLHHPPLTRKITILCNSFSSTHLKPHHCLASLDLISLPPPHNRCSCNQQHYRGLLFILFLTYKKHM